MPRVRGSDMPQRVSTRGLRTSSSDSDPLHHRPMTDRSPKLGDRRSPRTPHSEPLNQKKLGTRIAGLETQLEQAQGELKILKDQLASAEAAKKEAQKELEKRSRKSEPLPVQDMQQQHSNKETMSQEEETPQKETDVFEVPVEMVSMVEDEVVNTMSPQKLLLLPLVEEISLLKVRIQDKEKEAEALGEEKEGLKQEICSVKLKLKQYEEELGESRNEGIELKEKLKEVEEAKEGLETEMKKLRVQTEQWRKAADVAAAIVAGEVEMNDGRRRCGSMEDSHSHSVSVYDGLVDECDDGLAAGNGKRKGSGMKMFGDLWKKKGQK